MSSRFAFAFVAFRLSPFAFRLCAFAWTAPAPAASSSRALARTGVGHAPRRQSSAQSRRRAPASSSRSTRRHRPAAPHASSRSRNCVVAARGDLRQVRDAQHLEPLARAPAAVAPTTSATRPPMPASTSSKISVLPGASAGRQRLQRQHDARQLAARDDARERPQVLARDSARRRTRPRRCRARSTRSGGSSPSLNRTSNRVRAIASSAEQRLELARERRGRRRAAGATARARRRGTRRSPRRARFCRSSARSPAPVSRSRSRASAAPVSITSSSVGPYFRFSRSSSASRSSTCCSRAGRRVDAVGVAAQEERQVLELRLDAVARLEIRRELRIDRRQLADPLPDAAEPGEHRVVAVVERRVALLAQPLHALGAREHLPRRARAPRPRRASGAAFSISPSWNAIRSRRAAFSRASMRDAFELLAQRPHVRPTRAATSAASVVEVRRTRRAAADASSGSSSA